MPNVESACVLLPVPKVTFKFSKRKFLPPWHSIAAPPFPDEPPRIVISLMQIFCGRVTICWHSVSALPPIGSVSASVITPVPATALTTVVYQPGYQNDVPCVGPVIKMIIPAEKLPASAAVVVVIVLAPSVGALIA